MSEIPITPEQIRKLLAGEPVELAGMKVTARFKLEKFDGDYEPGKEPVEVIEGGDDLPTTITVGAHCCAPKGEDDAA
jgi:hypothetical protein